MTHETLATLVVDTLEKVTRYPRELLRLEADLEEDLGIDSVKMAEALSVLGDELGLPPDIEPSAIPIRTIDDVVSATLDLLNRNTVEVKKQPPTDASKTNGVSQASQPTYLVKPPLPLSGKIAFVTGSGHGIGQAIAEHLAGQGAHVLINSFHSRQAGEDVVSALNKKGLKATHLWGSVAQPEQLDKLFDQIDSDFGQLDFFVSNASNGMLGPLSSIRREHWDRAFRTNVMALHQGAFRAAAIMKKKGGGKIITLSSPGAHRYIEYFGCMGPVKAAVESLTRYLAVELGNDNIQVNCVSAGPIYGALLDKYPDSQRLVPYWESLSAGGRLGHASDVANFVAYLLSESANKITGSILLVDAGGSQRI